VVMHLIIIQVEHSSKFLAKENQCTLYTSTSPVQNAPFDAE